MGDRVQEYAGRILVHEEQAAQTAAQAQSFHAAALASRPVQEALSGHRWRLLDIQPQEDWDKAAGFAYTRALQATRSEEHTSELQSQSNIVCRLLLEKKKQQAVRDFDQAVKNFHAGTHRRPTWRKAGKHEGFRIVGGHASRITQLSRK